MSPVREVSLDMGEVHNLSLSILEFLEDEGVINDMALAGVALTLVRLANPLTALPAEQEVRFTAEIIQMVQLLQGGTIQ